MGVTHSVDLDKLDPTLDEMQEFIDEAKALGISGNVKIQVVGKSSGYNFTGSYTFTPKGLRARADGAIKRKAPAYDGPVD